MAELDPRIILAGENPQFNIGEKVARHAYARGQELQNAEAERTIRLRDLMKTGGIDAVRKEDPAAADQLSQQQLEHGVKSMELASRLLATVPTDRPAGDREAEAVYAKVRGQLASAGLNVDQYLPETFDPGLVRRMQDFSLTAKDRLEAQWKERGFDQQERALNETIRSNKATEGIAASKAGMPSGMSATFDPSTGSFSFQQGTGIGQTPIGTSSRTDVEKKIVNGVDLLSRLNSVQAQFTPEYQTLGDRAGKAWLGAQAKLGRSLKPDQEAKLGDYAAYRSTAVDNLNATLKEMSGAAVTPQEYERIKASMPNAGTGIFDGDDPVTFQSKMGRVSRDAKLAVARYTYWRSQGMSGNPWDNIALSDMPTVMAQREDELMARIKEANPDADATAVRAAVRDAMRKEFGF